MFDYSKPENSKPYPGAPRFWRRVWNPAGAGTMQQGMLGDKMVAIVTPPVPDGGLVIYGYSARSSYTEDYEVEDRHWERGMFPGICFSEICVDGEYGFTALHDVEEISEAEFRLAMSRGFR